MAVFFGLFLTVFAAGSIALAMSSLDSFILGTELNPNGTVEYLCLGRACENFQDFDW